MHEEKDFIEYLNRCEKGKELAEIKCIEGNKTHYFIMNSDMTSTFKMLKVLAAHRYYYSEKTNNNIIVDRLVVITNNNILPLVILCEEVDQIITLTDYELVCMNDYANTKPNDFLYLFPSIQKNDELFVKLFDVSSYVVQLKLPKQVVESKKSKFKVSLPSIELADIFIKSNYINPTRTLVVINFSENNYLSYDKYIWNDLLEFSIKENLEIFTFARNENEILDFTKKINISIDVLFALILRGVRVVSFQNTITDVMRIIDSQQLKALVVFNINENTKQLALNMGVNYNAVQFKKIRYITNASINNNVILEHFKDIYYAPYKNEKNVFLEGFKIAEKICKVNFETLYIIQNRHIGDCMRNLKNMKSIKGNFYQNKKVTNIIVVATPVLAGVACLCEDVDNIIVLPKKEIDILEKYASLTNRQHQNLISDEFDNLSMYKFYKFNDMQKKLMLPSKILGETISTYKISDKTTQNTIDYAKINDIIIDKSLILVPLAQTSTSIEQENFQLLIDYAIKSDYQVYTNCGLNQNELKGTKKLTVPVDQFCSLVKLGAKVVGVQCGLIDVLVWLEDPKLRGLIIMLMNSNMDVLYAKNRQITDKITEKGNFTYLKAEKEDIQKLDELILREFKRKYENG